MTAPADGAEVHDVGGAPASCNKIVQRPIRPPQCGFRRRHCVRGKHLEVAIACYKQPPPSVSAAQHRQQMQQQPRPPWEMRPRPPRPGSAPICRESLLPISLRRRAHQGRPASASATRPLSGAATRTTSAALQCSSPPDGSPSHPACSEGDPSITQVVADAQPINALVDRAVTRFVLQESDEEYADDFDELDDLDVHVGEHGTKIAVSQPSSPRDCPPECAAFSQEVAQSAPQRLLPKRPRSACGYYEFQRQRRLETKVFHPVRSGSSSPTRDGFAVQPGQAVHVSPRPNSAPSAGRKGSNSPCGTPQSVHLGAQFRGSQRPASASTAGRTGSSASMIWRADDHMSQASTAATRPHHDKVSENAAGWKAICAEPDDDTQLELERFDVWLDQQAIDIREEWRCLEEERQGCRPQRPASAATAREFTCRKQSRKYNRPSVAVPCPTVPPPVQRLMQRVTSSGTSAQQQLVPSSDVTDSREARLMSAVPVYMSAGSRARLHPSTSSRAKMCHRGLAAPTPAAVPMPCFVGVAQWDVPQMAKRVIASIKEKTHLGRSGGPAERTAVERAKRKRATTATREKRKQGKEIKCDGQGATVTDADGILQELRKITGVMKVRRLKGKFYDAGKHGEVEDVDSCSQCSSEDPQDLNETMLPRGRPCAEERWTDVFGRIALDGELHRDQLETALELGSAHRVAHHHVQKALEQAGSKFLTLSIDEFRTFISAYEAQVQAELVSEFRSCDDDGSGFVSASCLEGWLEDWGMKPMVHVFSEVLEEVGVDENGQVDLRQCEKIIEIISEREGFSLFEYKRLVKAFHTYDRDKSGTLDCNEIAGVLEYLYYSTDYKEAMSIVTSCDLDSTGHINEREFMLCMRKIRKAEVKRIQECLKKQATPKVACRKSRLMIAEECSDCRLDEVMKSLGYLPDAGAMSEAAKDAGLKLPVQFALLDDIWRFLEIYRDREGFTIADAEDIRSIFAQFAQQTDGSELILQESKLETCLRWLGYVAPREVRSMIIRDAELDDAHGLKFDAFKKLVRKFREKELDKARRRIREFDYHGGAPRQRAQNYFTIKHMLQNSRRYRRSFRQHEGFSPSEVRKYRKMFHQYDTDGDSELSKAEIRKLCEELAPELSTSRESRPTLLRLLTEVDDGDGTLCFQEFLALMRRFHELENEAYRVSEQRVVEETQMSPHDVQSLRRIFVAMDEDGKDYLVFDDLRKMLAGIVPPGDKSMMKLRKLWHEVVPQRGTNAEQLAFPNLLRLVRKLLDSPILGSGAVKSIGHRPERNSS